MSLCFTTGKCAEKRVVWCWAPSCSGFWAAALELVVIETFGVRKYEKFSSWDLTLVADTVPKTMH